MSELIRYINIPKISDDGDLIVAQSPDIPFQIQRVYSILNANPKFPRGFHAHIKNEQILFCLNSSIKIKLDDGREKAEVLLDTPEKGIYLGKMIWHEMYFFKKSTILLILASEKYDPGDYIRDYNEYIRLKI